MIWLKTTPHSETEEEMMKKLNIKKVSDKSAWEGQV